MAYIPQSGSVVTFQGDPSVLQAVVKVTNPVSTVGISPSSVMVLNPVSTLAVNPNPASVYVLNPVSTLSITPTANQSISGTVGVSIIGQPPPASVYVLNPVSTITVTPPANQSVSGTVQAELLSTNASIITVGGSTGNSSVQVLNFPANQSVSGTTDAAQTGTWRVSVVNSTPSSLLAGVSVIGLTPVAISGTPNVNAAGSIVAFQGTDPWIITGSVQASLTPAANQSVSGTVDVAQIGTWRTSVVNSTPSSLLAGVSIIGLPPVNVTNFPTNQNVSGSVVAFVSGVPNVNTAGSVAAWLQSSNASVITVGTAAANQSVSGTVDSAQIGAWRVSVINSTPSSLLAGVSIIGLPPVNITNTNLNVSGSVAAFNMSTNASFISVSKDSSVFAMQKNTWNVSITGAIAPTGTVTSVKATASTTNLLASNTSRRGATIGNYSGTSVMVKLGNMANSGDRTIDMVDGSYYELPFNYSGVIQHFASSTAGLIKITEIT